MTARARRRLVRGAVLAAVVAAIWGVWMTWWHELRERVGAPTEALDDPWYESRRVLDRHDTLVRDIPEELGRRGRAIALDDMGDRLVRATLVSEDREFFAHDGIDRLAILRAVEQNLRHTRLISGASTITQQLVKLLDARGVPGERTAARKLEEAARAQNLELALGKSEILAAYMNRLPYGHGLIGPAAAAAAYFGVAPRDLSWAQAALLAVLPRAPSWLDPYAHLERARLRQRALLQALHDHGDLDDATLARALGEPIVLRPITHPFSAPHFVQMLLDEDRVPERGELRTTLDLQLQHDVEGLVRTHAGAIAELGAGNAAVVVIDNASGDVLAWVGSADPDDARIAGAVDMIRAQRQPGSTLKPFVVAAALTAGHGIHELVADVPTEFAEDGGHVYAPGNFSGAYLGPVALREALAASLNVPMVRLTAELGADRVLTLLHALGFASLDRSAEHYGVSLALGTGEVELRELARAYVALARGGEAIALRTRMDDPSPTPVRVMSPAVAAAVTDALSDPLARVRLLAAGRSPFDIGFPVAVKTGTSSGYRDAWAVGYTAERTVAVWVGNADGKPTRGITGASGAGGLFADVMRRAMLGLGRRASLWPAEALVETEVCALSGLRAGPDCPHRVWRRHVPEQVPDHGCDLHVRVDARGTSWRCAPEGERVVVRLPPAFTDWLARLPDGAPGKDPDGLPWIAHDRVHGCDAPSTTAPRLRMVEPTDGSVYAHHGTDGATEVVRLHATLEGELAVDEVEFVIDGAIVGHSKAPFVARVSVPPGDHEVHARPRRRSIAIASGSARFAVR